MSTYNIFSLVKDPPEQEEPSSYLAPHIAPRRVQSMFQAVSDLVASEPWFAIPLEETPFRVQVPELGLKAGVLVALRPEACRSGFALFVNEAAWKAWLNRETPDPTCFEPAHDWHHLELITDEEDHLRETQVQEIEEFEWPVPSFFGYPDWYAVHEDQSRRALNQEELLLLEVVTRAFAECFEGERMDKWRRVWNGEDLMQMRLAPRCGTKHYEVRLSSESVQKSEKIWEQMQNWDPLANKVTVARYEELNDELLYRFRFSPEGYGQGLAMPYIENLLRTALSQMGCSIAQLTPNQLEIALQDSLVDTNEVAWEGELDFVLETLSGFYLYLQRTFGFDATLCIERLGHRDLYRRVRAAWAQVAA